MDLGCDLVHWPKLIIKAVPIKNTISTQIFQKCMPTGSCYWGIFFFTFSFYFLSLNILRRFPGTSSHVIILKCVIITVTSIKHVNAHRQ